VELNMAAPSEKIAESLEALKKLQDGGIVAIQTGDLSRTHRERLLRAGFLEEVIKGWYIPSYPDAEIGESTIWYASFWQFCSAYLNKRFGKNWCLSPEQSLLLHAGNQTVPHQLLVRSLKGNNTLTKFPFNTSILDVRHAMPDPKEIVVKHDLRLFSLPSSLISCSPKFFTQHPTDARTALSMIRDASEILGILLNGGHSTIAGRIAGAFRSMGQTHIADEIHSSMKMAGYTIREMNPFEDIPEITFSSREQSPYVIRMQLQWQEMRGVVIKHFPAPANKLQNISEYLKRVEEIYVTDAYHSLSIEGYRVTPELIQRVQDGLWNPKKNAKDSEQVAALAARGYWQAFKKVEKSLEKVLEKKNPGKVFSEDHREWYREMFAPCVTAGIIPPADLAGYRRGAVYIRRSMHVPPSRDAVRDLMPALCELLTRETNPAARVVLGHFFFVYIHPYPDGNGRMGRFLMNLMLAAGNYEWITIPVKQRSKYMSALEEASTKQDIKPFCQFLAALVKSSHFKI